MRLDDAFKQICPFSYASLAQPDRSREQRIQQIHDMCCEYIECPCIAQSRLGHHDGIPITQAYRNDLATEVDGEHNSGSCNSRSLVLEMLLSITVCTTHPRGPV